MRIDNPNIEAATGTSLSVSGQLTSTVSTGTAPLVVSSTTQVANLNAATAGTATNAVNVATTSTSTAASFYPLFVASTSNSNQAASLNSGFYFNPSTNALTATTFLGALTGNVTGNVSGTAATVTGATQASITTCANLTTVGTIGTGTWQGSVVGVTYGGTGVSSVTTTPSATAWAGWDANKNLSANNHIEGYATTATAGTTTTLTVSSAYLQFFTGSTTQTVQLPVASTLTNGMQWLIVNSSSGVVTVQTSGSNTVQSMASNSQVLVTCINTAGGTGTASWNWAYQSLSGSSGGTVTSVTFTGDGTVLSSTPSSAVTTSGTLSAALANAGAYTILGNNTSGSATPTYSTSPIVSGSMTANNFIEGYATTATAGTTTTLTSSSAYQQYFTGSTTQTVQLPVATTLVNGMQWLIVNTSSGTVTVQTSGLNTIQAMAANTQLIVTCINTAGGTGTASWNWAYQYLAGTLGTVTSVTFTGDGTILSSTPSSAVTSTGTVTATLATATAKSVLGNTSSSTATPTFTTSPVVSGSMTANTLVSTVSTGSAPLTISSTTNVANLNASSLNGATFASPGAIGSSSASTGAFTTITGSSSITLGTNGGTGGSVLLNGSSSGSATIQVAAAAGTSTIFQIPATNGTTGYALTTNGSGVTSWNYLSVAGGGTGYTSVTTTPSATAWAGWDANKNLSANNHIEGYATTATAGTTTTLVVGSTYQQYFTGSTTQTVTMPVATTLTNGMQWLIINTSSGVVTVQTSGLNTIQAMATNSQLIVTCINISGGTGTASWNWSYQPLTGGSGTVTSVTFTGDGTVLSSTPSSAVTTSGTVTASLASATAKSLLGNATASPATPTYTTAPVVSGTMTASSFNSTTPGAGYELSGTKILYYPNGDTYSIALGTALTSQSSTTQYNVAIGYNTSNSLTSSTFNTAVGAQSLYYPTGGYNTAFGGYALSGASSAAAANNTGIGYEAGGYITSGTNNIFLGYGAGYNGGTNAISSGSSNILIGYNITAPTATTSNYMNIGGAITATSLYGTPAVSIPGTLSVTGTTSTSNLIEGYTATATGATTTTLTVSSTYLQYFTGSTTQTVVLPVATTLVNGMQWLIVNNSTGNVLVQTSGGNTVQTLTTNSQLVITCINTAGGTGTASWNWSYQLQLGLGASRQTFTDGVNYTSGTTTTLTLSSTPSASTTLDIFFNGLYQEAATWSLTGAVITFTSAIPSGVSVVEATWSTTISTTSQVSISNDNATNATMYPLWVTASTGTLNPTVSSTKMTFNPSTASLAVTGNVTSPVIYGGSGASSTLTLDGTSNGSPSNAYVLLNPAGQGNVGVGVSTPSVTLQVGVTPLATVNTILGLSAAASTSYTQMNIQNTAAAGQSGYTATSADGSDTAHYVFLGMNNATGPSVTNSFFTNAHAASLYSVDNELDIGALGATGVINFYVNGYTTPNAIISTTGTSLATSVTSPSLNITGVSTFTQINETVVNLGATLSGTVNINLATGTYFYGTVTGTTTFTVTNPPSSGTLGSFTLELTNGGSQTITWTAGKWAGGAAPTLTTSGVDILTGFTRDAATTVRLALAMKGSA